MENTFDLKRVGNMYVYFRNPNCPKQAQNQPRKLESVVKFLTDEDFCVLVFVAASTSYLYSRFFCLIDEL